MIEPTQIEEIEPFLFSGSCGGRSPRKNQNKQEQIYVTYLGSPEHHGYVLADQAQYPLAGGQYL